MINLNEVNGTYSNLIFKNKDKIFSMYGDKSVDVNKFRNEILTITESAGDTKAKRNFIFILNKQRSKDQIVTYIGNIIMRADHLSSNVDDKWSNER